ncbi:MAG: glycosyltransferase [Anaerolineaceae bacterium]|nr:glycosyltransferase [Anaerolineaceae bacterium]
MTHILHIVDSLQVGGAQKLVTCFAREAINCGMKVSVISLSDSAGKIPAEELKALAIPVSVFPARRLSDLKRIAALVRYMRSPGSPGSQGSQSFDLVHTHLAYANILGGLAGRLAGLPVVSTLHSAGDDQTPANLANFSSPRGRVETIALKYFANRVIAVGESVAQAHRLRLGGKPISVITNAVPIPDPLSDEERQARRRQLQGDNEQILLISVGRFALVKELPDLITAFKQVKNLHPETKLVLIGDGSDRMRVETLIDDLNLKQDVVLLGRRGDVSDWLQSSDLYVSASSLEGLPVSILEAMAAGLPVVATAVGDVPHVVLPGMGTLVPAHQPDRLAEEICVMLDHPQQRQAMGKAALAHITKNYDVSTWFNQVITLYSSIPGKNGARLTPGGALV